MRIDSIGLFWEDIEKVKELKPQPPKRTPPPRIWEEAGYLPDLGAQPYQPQLFTPAELFQASMARERLVFDTEVYPNYFLAAFMSVTSGKAVYFEMTDKNPLDIAGLKWVLDNFTTIGFASWDFDLTVTNIAISGCDIDALNVAVHRLIVGQEKPWMVLRSHKLRTLKLEHIDLIEVAPLQASLKIYGGRLHAPRLQDLPFKPNTVLTPEQIAVVRAYCIGADLVNTAYLYTELKEQVELRERMSLQYGMDLRSKSDAQVAETVITHEYQRISFSKPTKPEIAVGTVYKYKVPEYIKYSTQLMKHVLSVVAAQDYKVAETGSIENPQALADMQINIAAGVYQMGIGGLHSTESKAVHIADETTLLIDRDVASYYPAILLNLKLYPHHLGPSFLHIYKSLVDRRLECKKKSGDKTLMPEERASWKAQADALKISINGIFGKTGNKYSVMYAPDMLIQITLTGQLSLLMLIERAELAGITVASANTDGILFKCPASRKAELDAMIAVWETETGFTTEETLYKALYSRDVNNYIAVKTDGKCKTKGVYSEKGSALNSVLSKNPEVLVCSDAVQALLSKGIPVATTVRSCKDVRRFVSLRTVKGGAVKDGRYIGKAVRWYYATGQTGEIIYALNGNKVPKSDGAKPLMDLPGALPEDIDYNWYEQEANSMLADLGCPQVEAQPIG